MSLRLKTAKAVTTWASKPAAPTSDLRAGWYPNPANAAELRYWRGGEWSDIVRPAVVPTLRSIIAGSVKNYADTDPLERKLRRLGVNL